MTKKEKKNRKNIAIQAMRYKEKAERYKGEIEELKKQY